MLKEKALRWILIVTLLVAVAMPLLNILYIAPRFSALMIQNVEIESIKVCSHIGREIVTDEYWQDWISRGLIPDFIAIELEGITNDLGLIKIKFFQPDGTIIYSTDIADIGDINRHEYFHSIVAKGKGFSKLVSKQTSSLEGQTYDIDVAEVYVPIMRNGRFLGAFELYHDVTAQAAKISSLTLQASLIPAVVATLFVLMVLKTLRNLQLSMAEQKQSESDVIEALDAAWQLTESLEEKNSELQTINQVVEQAHAELQAAQAQMLQQEKMASLGVLATGAAHEIYNPVGDISSNLHTLVKYFDRFMEYFAAETELLKDDRFVDVFARLESERNRLNIGTAIMDASALIAESLEGAERVKSIVRDMENLSPVDTSEFKMTGINACFDSALKVVRNKINSKAAIVCDYGDLPPVNCIPQQINQVFVNLLVNVAQALEMRGEIKVCTWVEDDQVLVSIADNGHGMPLTAQEKIYEPFFTTNEGGKGTGFGMDVSQKIIRIHGGEIKVATKLKEGSTYLIRLPVNPSLADHGNELSARGVRAS